VRARAVTTTDALDVTALYGISPEQGRVKTMAVLGSAATPPAVHEMHRKYVGARSDGTPLADEFHWQLRPIEEYDDDGQQLAGLFWRNERHGYDADGVIISDRRTGAIDFLPVQQPLHDEALGSLMRMAMVATGLKAAAQS